MVKYNYIGVDKEYLVPMFSQEDETNTIKSMTELLNNNDHVLIVGDVSVFKPFNVFEKAIRVNLKRLVIQPTGLYYEYFISQRRELKGVELYTIDNDDLEKYYDEDKNDYYVDIERNNRVYKYKI